LDLKSEIISLLEQNCEVFDGAFVKTTVTPEQLNAVQASLDMIIPEQYRWFLEKFGHGGFGFEFLGFGLTGKALFAEKTVHERQSGLPMHLLVIEDIGEYVVCLDSQSGEVVTWSRFDKDGTVKLCGSFCEHFLERINDAAANY